ncbi:hypothetical protein BU23DRAFT_477557 [Bimuria novae-zelandiae CBS 107.79]|uniref:Uncharacterized protein n=1 Tax=Bimuria novae-zelandiae CBS 107.79 TaxID=1447943 RepID=A0A6A5V7L9_9PLEO|nr:hypothetical protein BU23DRAFT_477557 [Bimuria novae-zelandiae CBS 107.79]
MSTNLPDLRTAWVEACTKFKEATGFDLAAAATAGEGRDDIVAKFNNVKAKNAKDQQKMEKVKTVVGKTLVAVERLGQVAADGVAMVFGSPANITMNCISFFINAGIEYKNIANNIEDLFGRIITIMERFQIYRDNEQLLKPPMIRVAHRLLISVVDICRICYENLRKNRAKKFFGIALFSDDGGIKDQFALLDSLEDQELQMKTTSTLVAAEKTQKSIQALDAQNAKIASFVTDLTESGTDQKILKELKEKLGVDESLSKGEYQWYYDKLDSDSCSWLKTDTLYQSWSNAKEDKTPLLLLQGEEGCGKSYILTAIIRDLRTQYPQNQDGVARISVGYCYLTRGGKKNGEGPKGERSIRDALREWAWQVINKDVFYRKNIQATFKKSADLGDLEEIWKKLFLDHLNDNVTFYLALDGTHELDERGMHDLCTLIQTLSPSELSTGRLKVAITARPTLVKNLSVPNSISTPLVDLREKNRADMEKFIRDKASNLTIFQKTSEQVQALKEEVCTTLLDAVDGNFSLADLKLKEISNKYDPEEVKQIIHSVSGNADLKNSVVDIIREANRTLTTREMEDLNTLLLWVMYGQWGMQIYELEAVLFVEQGRESLQPLVHEIKEKFSSFFELDGDNTYATVELKYDSIADYFKTIAIENQVSETSQSKALTKGEIRLVQHFVEKLCDQDIYSRLGLGDFFDQKISQSDVGVTVDCDNAHAKVALTCLRVNSENMGPECSPLNTYAATNLVSHFKQIDMDRVDPRLKAELGLPLVRTFRDPVCIRKTNAWPWSGWSYMDEGLQNVVRLFRSSALTSKIDTGGTDHRAWVDAVLKEPIPEVALLKDTAKLMTDKWLSEEDGEEIVDCFRWLYGYMNKIQNAENPNKPRYGKPYAVSTIDIEDIENVVQTVQRLQALDMSDTMTLRNLAITYRECEHITEAIEQFKHILSFDSEHLFTHAGLARAYAAEVKGGPKPDWQNAIHHYDIVIERCKTGVRLFSDVVPEEQIRILLVQKAFWLRKLEQFDAAQEIYLKMLQDDPENDTIRLEFILTLCEAQNYSVVVETLETLNQIEEETHKNRLSRFFHNHADDESCHSSIVQAFKQSGLISRVRSYYEQSLADARQDESEWVSKWVRTTLTYRLAAMLWNHGSNETEKEEAIKMWESLLSEENNYDQIRAARRLARIYITKAVEAGRDSPVAAEMLERVQKFGRPSDGAKADDDDSWGIGLTSGQARSLLARYYSRVGDFKTARRLLRSDLDVGLKLLSDEDLENDWQGYRKLGDVFMDCGDDENAIAAWSMIQPTQGLQLYRDYAPSTITNDESNAALETGEIRPLMRHATTSFSLAKKLEGPLGYSCDGKCGKQWTFADDIYICRECIDTQFDAPCLEKLRRGALSCDACDKDHAFLHIPAWDIENADRAEAGKILVGGDVLDVNEWKEAIRKEWDTTEVNGVEGSTAVDAAA